MFSPVVDENKIVHEWFQLADNFIPNLEALRRKKGTHAYTSFATPLTTEPLIPVPADTNAMAQKSLHESSVPAVVNVPTRPTINIGDKNFELRNGVITMCMLVHSVVYRVRTPTLTYNTSLNCATPSSSKTSHPRLSGSVCFPSLSWGR
jgi:hypothetical protein